MDQSPAQAMPPRRKTTDIVKAESRAVAAVVLLVALLVAPLLVPFWFLVGVLHFGFVSGPDPTVGRWASYTASSLVPAAIVFAWLLRRRVNRATDRRLGLWQAFVVALFSLAFVNGAMGLITVGQYGHDGTVFTVGLLCASAAAVGLTLLLSQRE
ncbi:MAG: hypothetical protein JWN72_513 [Thermoleophilia bacterium]|nr:hypothetical protein [Thermoleophilia bacterium]